MSTLIRTIGDVTVSAVLNDITEAALNALVARKVQRVGWPRPQHCDVEASEGPQEALGGHNLFQSPVHAAVLSLRVWL